MEPVNTGISIQFLIIIFVTKTQESLQFEQIKSKLSN